MANHHLTKFLFVCLAVTTISSFRLDEQSALKIRKVRQCPKCPADSPETLSSSWSGTPELQNRDKRSSRDGEPEVVEKSESGSASDSEGVKKAIPRSGGIDLSRVSFEEVGKGIEDDNEDSSKRKQRREATKYSTDDLAPPRILVSGSPTGSTEGIEGRTFMLRRVDGTSPKTNNNLNDQPNSQAFKYFANIDRLMSIYDEVQKFRAEYSKKTIYDYLESTVHHILQNLVFDHIPSLLMAREASDNGGKISRFGKRNSDPSGFSMYDSDEIDVKLDTSRITEELPVPEVELGSKMRPIDIFEYSEEPRDVSSENPSSNPLEDFRFRNDRPSSYENFRDIPETSRFPYRSPIDVSESDRLVYRQTSPIDNSRYPAKRQTPEVLPVSKNDRLSSAISGNLEKSKTLPVRKSDISETSDKSARIARSTDSDVIPDSEDNEKSEKSKISGDEEKSENLSSRFDETNGTSSNDTENVGNIDIIQKYTINSESTEMLENMEKLEEQLLAGLESLGSIENMSNEEIKRMANILETLLTLERDHAKLTRVAENIEKTLTTTEENATTEKSHESMST